MQELKNEDAALRTAERIYHQQQLDTVAVISYDLITQDFHCIYKCERRCKHKAIQGEWDFTPGNRLIRFICQNCRDEIKR